MEEDPGKSPGTFQLLETGKRRRNLVRSLGRSGRWGRRKTRKDTKGGPLDLKTGASLALFARSGEDESWVAVGSGRVAGEGASSCRQTPGGRCSHKAFQLLL